MFLIRLLSKLPLVLLYRVADIVYFLMYYFPGYRKAVVRRNLENSFPSKNKEEIRSLMKRFYSNLVDVSFETIRIPSIRKDELQERFRVTNFDYFHSIVDENASAIVLTGHQCNWEWLLLSCSIDCKFPIDAVYKPLHILSMDKLFIEMRSKFGAEPIAMKDVYRNIVKKKNEKRVLAMVADQTPAHSEIQYFTNFLNQNTAFFVGADKIARHTGYPVFYLEVKRIKRGYYEGEFRLLKEAPFDTQNFEVIELYARSLEKSIEQNPSDWLWSHRRWKHQSMKVKRTK